MAFKTKQTMIGSGLAKISLIRAIQRSKGRNKANPAFSPRLRVSVGVDSKQQPGHFLLWGGSLPIPG
jgi:hypothetical protein